MEKLLRRMFPKNDFTFLLPLRATEQDRAMLGALRKTWDAPYQLVVMHAHRGARKSFVVHRVAFRSRFLVTYPTVHYVNARCLTEHELNEKVDNWRQGNSLVSAFLFSIAAALLGYCCWCGGKPGETAEEGGEAAATQRRSFQTIRNALQGAYDEFPSRTALACYACLLLLAARRFRRRVLVLDDAVDGMPRTDRGLAVGRRALERISALGHTGGVLLISSNDGVMECFLDVTSAKRRTASFPAASDKQLLEALHSIGGVLAKVTQAHVAQAAQRNLEHHARSLRWWGQLAEVNTSSCLLQYTRTFLWKIVINLDIETSSEFRAQALGLSRPLTSEERQKLKALVGLKKDVPQCPRRLGLAWAMVMSSSGDEELSQLDDLSRKLLAARSEDALTQRLYETHVEPLVKELESLYPRLKANRLDPGKYLR